MWPSPFGEADGESEGFGPPLDGDRTFASWEWDLVGDRFQWSQGASGLLGLGGREPGACFDSLLSAVHPEDRELVLRAVDRAMVKKGSYSLDHRIVCGDGSVRLLHQRGRVSCGPAGHPVRLHGIVLDITDQGLAEDGLHQRPGYDLLTGLPNRVMFRRLLENAILRSRRSHGQIALLLLAIDRFDEIQQGLGQDFSGQLLRQFSQWLIRSLRSTDLVTPSTRSRLWIGRQRDGELVILLHDVRRSEDPARVAQRLLEGLSEPFQVDGLEMFLTASIGIALFPADAVDAEGLLRSSETAKRYAREAGGSAFRFFDESMNATTVRRFELEARLRQALRQGELELVYQPQLDALTRELVGVEALVRWNHPEHGLLLPQDFVPIAEDSGLIVELGAWVLRSACRQMEAWCRAGFPGVRVAVNVSSRQLRTPGFVASVAESLAGCGLDPRCLELELTERSMVANDEPTLAVLRELKQMTVRLAVDDFGTGHSAITYLKQLPLDALKIDRSFISGMTSDRCDAAITTAVIALAQRLRIRVVAEGVETEQQLAALRELGCDEVQGFLLAPPLSAGEILDLLRSPVSQAAAG